jgi:hypothetical protein
MGSAVQVLANPVAAVQGALGDPISQQVSTLSGGALSSIAGIGNTEGMDGARSDMANATMEANNYLKNAYDSQMGFAKPWEQAGLAGLAGLQNFNYQQDPGYQFRLNQGLNGINNSLAARGMANSGRALKALTGYNQDFASNEYQNAYNRNFNTMSALAGMGQNAYQNMGNWAGQYGQGAANNKMQLGQANAGYNIARGNQSKDLLGQGLGFAAKFLGLGI